MVVKMHRRGFDHAKRLIDEGRFVVDLCAVLSAESRAGQYTHLDIENAAAHLHGMLQAVKS